MPGPLVIDASMTALRPMFEGESFADNYSISMWGNIQHLLRSAVWFDFAPGIEPNEELIKFSEGMMEHHKFALPFKSVLYTTPISPKSAILAATSDDGRMAVVVFSQMVGHDEKPMGMIPILMSSVPIKGNLETDRVDYRSLVKDSYSRKNPGQLLGAAEIEDRSGRSVALACSFTAALMSKDVESRHEGPKPGVNERRVAAGKRPIQERNYVCIRPRSISREGIEFGDRASPRMHWRRGHFRRLPNGDVIPIAPMIINGNGASAPGPKDYRMSKKFVPAEITLDHSVIRG